MSVYPRRDWREICEELLQERDTERVTELLEELLDALDERERTAGHQPEIKPESQPS
jgi:hypothetical protein